MLAVLSAVVVDSPYYPSLPKTIFSVDLVVLDDWIDLELVVVIVLADMVVELVFLIVPVVVELVLEVESDLVKVEVPAP